MHWQQRIVKALFDGYDIQASMWPIC
jgi:hypothetical protein